MFTHHGSRTRGAAQLSPLREDDASWATPAGGILHTARGRVSHMQHDLTEADTKGHLPGGLDISFLLSLQAGRLLPGPQMATFSGLSP